MSKVTIIEAVIRAVVLVVAGVAAGVEAVFLPVLLGAGGPRHRQALARGAQHDEPTAAVVQHASVRR